MLSLLLHHLLFTFSLSDDPGYCKLVETSCLLIHISFILLFNGQVVEALIKA